MFESIVSLGSASIRVVMGLGQSWLILMGALLHFPRFKKNFPLLMQQLYAVGVLSLIIIIVSGLFIGMVIALQGYNTLAKFGASSELGQLVALAVVRELGPVMTALLFAGRAGSALTAEIALMKATDQLSSMEMMAVDPLRRVIAPRFWAGFISMPLLTLVFNAVAVYGAFLVGVKWLGVDSGTFWSNMSSSVDFYADVLSGLVKSVVFGFVVTWIAVYQGYACEPTSRGMARATTKTVVYSSLLILGLDFVLTTMMIGGW